jgi:hypothetical protein
MSIIERSPRTAPTDRLRVITGGRVGNMEARLGTSGFDVIAVADTEDELLIAVAADEPDAIVVEADLCESLERVHDLAPDAVLIVVGDHTPAGAIGRIERGVTGTVMAGLLHALVPAGPVHAGSVVAAKAQAIGEQLTRTARTHGGLAAAATSVAVGVTAAAVLVTSPPRIHQRAERIDRATPVVRSLEPRPTAHVVPTPPPDRAPARGGDRSRNRGSAGAGSGRDDFAFGGGVAPVDHGGDGHAGTGSSPPPPTVDPTPPPDDGSGDGSGDHPPGNANGWHNKPPKHDDQGAHEGWTKGKGPKKHAASA